MKKAVFGFVAIIALFALAYLIYTGEFWDAFFPTVVTAIVLLIFSLKKLMIGRRK